MPLPIESPLVISLPLFVLLLPPIGPFLVISPPLFVLPLLLFLFSLMQSVSPLPFFLLKPVTLLPFFLSILLTLARVFLILLFVFLWHLFHLSAVSIPALVFVLIFLLTTSMLIALIVVDVLPAFF